MCKVRPKPNKIKEVISASVIVITVEYLRKTN